VKGRHVLTSSHGSLGLALGPLLLCVGLSGIARVDGAAAARLHPQTSCYRSQSAPGQPEAYPALFRFVQGHWSCTHVLHLGDRALVVLRFTWRPSPVISNHGWNHPAARVVIVKRDARYIVGNYTVGTGGLLYVSPLRSTLMPDGFTRFTGEVDIPRTAQWVGQRRIMFFVGKGSAPSHFRNNSGLYGFAIDPIPSILPSAGFTVRKTQHAEISKLATASSTAGGRGQCTACQLVLRVSP